MWEVVAPRVTWSSVDEWRALSGRWPYIYIPSAVCAIDATSHLVYRPLVGQQEFYSGHRHIHCIHTQIIIDTNKNIRYIKSGFVGHSNDAQTYQRMDNIGPGADLDFPDGCYLLADKAYPNRHPLMTPYKAAQIRRQPPHRQALCRRFNRNHSKIRVYVEHIVRQLKIYRCIRAFSRLGSATIRLIIHGYFDVGDHIILMVL